MLNSVIENIRSRRSIRKYKNRKISPERVKRIIDAALYAPSSHNRQPWNFKVITGKKLIDEISGDIKEWYKSVIRLAKPLSFIEEVKASVKEMSARAKTEKDLFFYHAPCVIVIHSRKKRFFLKDCSCAAQNIMLAARSLNIGSCWIGLADIALNKSRKIRKKLRIPLSHRIMATIALGYPEKFPRKALPRKKADIEWLS
ncbi:hypothetical protein GF323_03255 [Candidatus Woesearchaeota archaeon]|nr:hypothetical protein [Candidatus Woesearchaeota archaeon]